MIPQPSLQIVDGMAMVQKLRGDQKTFAEVANCIMSMALHEGTDSQCIDMVIDVYRDCSIKNADREKRSFKSGHELRKIRQRKILQKSH